MKKTFIAGITMLMALTIGVGSSIFAQNEQVPPTTLTDVVSVSAGLTPSSPFYFLDRLGEFLQELFTFSPEAKVKLKVEFAKERITEIKIMLEDDEVDADDVEEAQSLLVADMEDAQNIADEEEIDDDNISEFTSLLDDEIDTDDEDTKQTFEEVKDQLNDDQDDEDIDDDVEDIEDEADDVEDEADDVEVRNNDESKNVQEQRGRDESSGD